MLNGETSFFRHPAWFERFQETLAECPSQTAVWSAGCSGGQEAYSLAMAARQAAGAAERVVRVLGTDISRRQLAKAAAGAYSEAELRECPAAMRARHFVPAPDGRGWVVCPEVARQVRFDHANLLDPATYPALSPDVIFCRNVLLYFRPDVRLRCLERLRNCLRPGGWLFLGPADALGVGRLPGLTRVPDPDCVWFRRTV